jgi:hypothetical protein
MATKLARLDPNPAGSVIDLPPRSGSIIQIYGSADLLGSIKNIYRSGTLRSKYFSVTKGLLVVFFLLVSEVDYLWGTLILPPRYMA